MSKPLNLYLTTGSGEHPGVKWVPNEQVVLWHDYRSDNAYFQVCTKV